MRAERELVAQGLGSAHDRSERRPTRGQAVAQVRGVLAERVVISTPLDPLLDLRALAGYSSLSRRTLRSFLELPPDTALPCYRLPGKVLVRRSEFDGWLEQYRSRGRPSLARALREWGLDKGTV